MIRFLIRLINSLLARFQVIRFMIVGGTSAIIEFSLLVLLVEKLKMGYLPGNVLAFSLTNIITYLLSRYFVFSPTDRKKRHEAALFIVFLSGGLAINQTVLWAVVEFIGLDYKISKVVAILVTIIWNFFTRKYIVFKPVEIEPEEVKNP